MANIQSITIGRNDSEFSPAWDLDDSEIFYKQSFSDLFFPKLELRNPPQNEYVIYVNKTEYKVVQATTALEAMEQANIKNPLKIIHTGSRLANIIEHAKLQQAKEVEATQSDEKMASPTVEEKPAAQAAPQEAAPAKQAAAAPQSETPKAQPTAAQPAEAQAPKPS